MPSTSANERQADERLRMDSRMTYQKLFEQISGRPVVIDESASLFKIEDTLTKARIQWRKFPPRTLDEQIESKMLPEEVLLTRDMQFHKRMIASGKQSILLPINGGHKKRRVRQAMTRKNELLNLEKSGKLQLLLRWGMANLFGVVCGVCLQTFPSINKRNSHIFKIHNEKMNG